MQVATVMGFDDELDVTDDIGAADVILASSSEMKQNPWIHNVAKYHKLPIFVVKVTARSIDFVLATTDSVCINIPLFYIVNGRLIRWLK